MKSGDVITAIYKPLSFTGLREKPRRSGRG
ncbi:hypothetical protein CARN8_5310003 [mine drainage metagenome]|uniref:Uncharacterized protein n=1 Tax=mine drainage metagenome TaxID=410659 RepID=A0A3P3ZR34_9ZZZZ